MAKSRHKQSKRSLIAQAAALFAALACTFFLAIYIFYKPKPIAYDLYALSQEISSQSIQLCVNRFEKLLSIPNFALEKGYSYYLLEYTYRNVAAFSLKEPDAYPYVCIAALVQKGSSLVKDASFAASPDFMFDYSALKAYGIANAVNFSGLSSDLSPGEERTDIDIVKIKDTDRAKANLYIAIEDLKAAIPLHGLY
ncbi:MAG: hypothetical protein FWG30_11705 [Eubacteriaceae bacterium]|nr:hypothetical protein [Eubacteriaceae bacterium]